MTIKTEVERLRRLQEMCEGPLDKIRKQQSALDRVLQLQSPAMQMLERMQHPSYAETLANQIEKLNRQSALFDAAQSIMARPAMLVQMEALAKQSDEMKRLTDHALLPDHLGPSCYG